VHNSIVFMIVIFKLLYITIAACQRPVGPLLSNKCMYVCNHAEQTDMPGLSLSDFYAIPIW